MDVIRLTNTRPQVNIHNPGPGVGGPCLPNDPYLLITAKEIERSIVKTARSINDSMSAHVVGLLLKAIDLNNKKKESLNIVILGVYYKANVNDTRYSPSESMIKHLTGKSFVNITVHDPYSEESFEEKISSDLHSILLLSDCVIIATAHSIYSSLNANYFKKGCIIMDSIRILNKKDFLNSGILDMHLRA